MPPVGPWFRVLGQSRNRAQRGRRPGICTVEEASGAAVTCTGLQTRAEQTHAGSTSHTHAHTGTEAAAAPAWHTPRAILGAASQWSAGRAATVGAKPNALRPFHPLGPDILSSPSLTVRTGLITLPRRAASEMEPPRQRQVTLEQKRGVTEARGRGGKSCAGVGRVTGNTLQVGGWRCGKPSQGFSYATDAGSEVGGQAAVRLRCYSASSQVRTTGRRQDFIPPAFLSPLFPVSASTVKANKAEHPLPPPWNPPSRGTLAKGVLTCPHLLSLPPPGL